MSNPPHPTPYKNWPRRERNVLREREILLILDGFARNFTRLDNQLSISLGQGSKWRIYQVILSSLATFQSTSLPRPPLSYHWPRFKSLLLFRVPNHVHLYSSLTPLSPTCKAAPLILEYFSIRPEAKAGSSTVRYSMTFP